jgi:hypothetical protein
MFRIMTRAFASSTPGGYPQRFAMPEDAMHALAE